MAALLSPPAPALIAFYCPRWLCCLPTLLLQGVPTEREVLTTEKGLPVYRLMLRRI